VPNCNITSLVNIATAATTAQQCTTKPSGRGAEPGADQETSQPGQQPKRILGVMPNFRAVSAGAVPPPPTPKHNLWIATQNSFDYSSFIFVGITSLLAEGTDAHKDLGKGIGGRSREIDLESWAENDFCGGGIDLRSDRLVQINGDGHSVSNAIEHCCRGVYCRLAASDSGFGTSPGGSQLFGTTHDEVD
jgi:hypothetical protein